MTNSKDEINIFSELERFYRLFFTRSHGYCDFGSDASEISKVTEVIPRFPTRRTSWR